MKRLEFHYKMTIQFDVPVKNHHFTLKCLPHHDGMQKVEKLDHLVYPNYFISYSRDSFQNECIYGFCAEEHDHFMVDVNGIVETGRNGLSLAYMGEESILKYQTRHTMPGKEITARHHVLKNSCLQTFGEKEDVRAKATYYMQWLYEHFTYESGATSITTTAEEAFAAGKGVCQDYAHILLSFLRMDQIPCRYVTGMMIGEGLSHAWVEVLTEDGWLAIDPTNARMVDADYITIARGRDYKDCLLNQGVFVGCERKAVQTQEVRVEVKEIG